MFPSDQCSLAQWLLLRTGLWQQLGHGSPNRNKGLLVERRNGLSIFILFKPSFSSSNDIKRNCYLPDFCGHKNVGYGEIPSLGCLWNPTSGVIHVLGDCEPFYLPGSPGLSLLTRLWSGLHQALSVSITLYNSAFLHFISRTSDLYRWKTQIFVAQPPKVRDAWTPQWFPISPGTAYQYRAFTGRTDIVISCSFSLRPMFF